ncbi:MAG: ArnT family glycosyltransferase [Actinomycetota bacterium]
MNHAGPKGLDGLDARDYRVATAALAGLAAVLLAYPLIRSFWDFEIDINEGWNAYHAVLAMAGRSLYVHDSPYYFNNYPPLSFYIVGALGRLLGDPVLAGRLLSVVAVGVIGWAAGDVVRSAGGSRTDARLAMATCLLQFAAFATDYIGMDDPQLLGQAFLMAGLAAYMRGAETAGRGALVAALFSAGLLVKHNMIALPLLVAADLARRGPNRARAGFFATGLGLAGLAAGGILLLVGKTFFTQLLASRTWSVERAFIFTTEITGRLHAPLLVATLGLLWTRRNRPAGLVLAWLAAALALGVFFAGGGGTDINIWFDVSIALAIGTGLAAKAVGERLGPQRTKLAVALVANAGVLLYAPLCLGRFGVEVAGEMNEREALFKAETEYVRSIPGPALCESQLLCYRAGKPAFWDSFNAYQAMLHGRIPADTLTAMIERHELAVVQISDPPPLDDFPGQRSLPERFPHYPDAVFAALAREYVLDRVGVSGRFWRPRQR